MVAATELEFTLVDDSDDTLSPVKNPLTGREIGSEEILSIAQLDLFDPFLSELYEAKLSVVQHGGRPLVLHHHAA